MEAAGTPNRARGGFGDRLARRVLLGPAIVSRAAAAGRGRNPEEAWMLRQDRSVRESYVREVIDCGADPRLAEIWMLRQSDKVRASYVREVLEPALGDTSSDGR